MSGVSSAAPTRSLQLSSPGATVTMSTPHFTYTTLLPIIGTASTRAQHGNVTSTFEYRPDGDRCGSSSRFNGSF